MIILKNKVLCALCMLTWLGIPSSTFAQNAKTNHSSQSMDSLSYALGVLFANNLSNEGLSSVDGASLKSGFEATLAGEATMTAAEADAHVRSEMMKLKEAQGQAIKKEGEAFLAENSGKDGINTTETGLQYQHTVMGTGASPDANDAPVASFSPSVGDTLENSRGPLDWLNLPPDERKGYDGLVSAYLSSG